MNYAVARCPCFLTLAVPNQFRYPAWGQEPGCLMHRHCRLLAEKWILSPAYCYTIGTSGNAVKCHIISALLWLDYLPTYIPVCLFLYIKLRLNYNPPVKFADETSQFQWKFWEKRDITVQPAITYIYLCVRWYAACLSYFFKPSNWNVRQT
jgi:hypothetical protein